MNFVRTASLYTPFASQSGADHPPFQASCSGAGIPTCCGDTLMQSDPKRGTFVSTAFDGAFCQANLHRLLYVSSGKVLTAAAASPGWDKILMVVNDDTYGGAVLRDEADESLPPGCSERAQMGTPQRPSGISLPEKRASYA